MASRFKHVWFLILCSLLVLVMGVNQTSSAFAQSNIDVVLHYVEGFPSDTEVSYQVKAFLSVVDSTGSPINDLKAEDFTLTEDSQKVEIESVGLAEDPLNLLLVIDTSGSMAGQGITAAKAAASSFVTSLAAEDRVAIMTFNDQSTNMIDFTTDHIAARDKISLIDAVRNAGTCLYDTAYQAIQTTATLPSGRRAVIVFTDGVDEKMNGDVCSIHTSDDVIKIATDGGTRTPVYTMGMGSKVDQNGLARIAQTTGGRFFFSPDPTRVDAIFRDLSNTLRSQYAIVYKSSAGPGAHTLAASAKYLGAQDTDTRAFLLPNFPFRLTFTEPSEGSEVSGTTTFSVETFGQSETVQAVVFEVNGENIGRRESSPYSADLDLSTFPVGALTVDAVALGADGIELDRVSVNVTISDNVSQESSSESSSGNQSDSSTTTSFLSNPNLIMIGVGGILVLVVVGVLVFNSAKKKRQEKEREEAWNRQVNPGSDLPNTDMGSDDRTMDSWEIPTDALGRLRVLASDDATMINQHFDLTSRRTTLGRKADNDIIFPKDAPVSRHHAVIEEKNGGLFFSEVVDSESGKRPAYGTFVNDREVGDDPILLQTGDEILLGKRLRLKFEAGRASGGDEQTYDGFSDETMDTM